MERISDQTAYPPLPSCPMMMRVCVFFVVLGCLGLLLASFGVVTACTTVALGKKASADGSTLIAHTNDGGAKTDGRIVLVPAMDHDPIIDKRYIFVDEDNFPRYCGYERGSIPAYSPLDQHNCTTTKPIGWIPQVQHTYGYFEESYGIVNEVCIYDTLCSFQFNSHMSAYKCTSHTLTHSLSHTLSLS
jgi:hypothetical protein